MADASPYRHFALQLGYAESERLCVMLVYHDDGFPGIEEALDSLRATAFTYLRESAPGRACCNASRVKYELTPEQRCTECGHRVGKDTVASADVAEFFHELPARTLDGSSRILDHFAEYGWDLVPHVRVLAPCWVYHVGRWMAREDDERPVVTGEYPDGRSWSTR